MCGRCGLRPEFVKWCDDNYLDLIVSKKTRERIIDYTHITVYEASAIKIVEIAFGTRICVKRKLSSFNERTFFKQLPLSFH